MSDRPKRTRVVRAYSHMHDSYVATITVEGHPEPQQDIQHADGPMTTHAEWDDKRAEVRIDGCAPQGEEEAPETCRRLAAALTARDNTCWTYEPEGVPLPAWVDGYVHNAAKNSPVPVQVTHAGSAERWRSLNTEGEVFESLTIAHAAEEVWDAIARKRMAGDAAMILAVRGQPGVHAMPAVVEEFLAKHAAELGALRYHAIWLIGPTVGTTFCLHEKPSD